MELIQLFIIKSMIPFGPDFFKSIFSLEKCFLIKASETLRIICITCKIKIKESQFYPTLLEKYDRQIGLLSTLNLGVNLWVNDLLSVIVVGNQYLALLGN